MLTVSAHLTSEYGPQRKHVVVFIVFFVLFGITSFLFCQPTYAQTLKVGYYEARGFNTIENDGTYSGYGYDYLMEISKYTIISQSKRQYFSLSKARNRPITLFVELQINSKLEHPKFPTQNFLIDFNPLGGVHGGFTRGAIPYHVHSYWGIYIKEKMTQYIEHIIGIKGFYIGRYKNKA